MKNIYKSAIILSVSLATVGCNGFLDRFPYDEVSSKAVYSSATLAENAVVGAYSNLLAGYISSDYKNIIAYMLLILFLFVKPTGIFNEKAIQDV